MGCTRTFSPRDLTDLLCDLERVLFRAGGLWVVLLPFVFTLACRIGKKVRNRLAKGLNSRRDQMPL